MFPQDFASHILLKSLDVCHG